jgi:hypothetical protein
MSSVSIVPVHPIAMQLRWREVERELHKSVTLYGQGRFMPADILKLATENKLLCWFVLRGDELLAVAITDVLKTPQKSICEIWGLGGTEMAEWVTQIRSAITDYARQVGCQQLQIIGRPGWGRMYDVKPAAVILVEELPQSESERQAEPN